MTATNYIKRQLIPFLREVVKATLLDDCFFMSAALAYYTIFSLAPVLIILVAIAGFVLDKTEIRTQLYQNVARLTNNQDTALLIQNLLDNLSFASYGLTATLVSFATVVIGASTVFAVLHSSLNKIWEVPAKQQSGIVKNLFQRLLGLLTIFLMGIMSLVSLAASAFLSSLYYLVQKWVNIPRLLLSILQNGLPYLIIFLFILLIFKILSDARITWKLAAFGSICTLFLLFVGRWLISFYLSSTSVGAVYGTAASLATLLLWVYCAAFMLFVGAECIKVYARFTETNIHPSFSSKA